MKKIFQSLLWIAAVAGSAVSVSSCSGEDEMEQAGETKKVPLEIVTSVATRSIITGTTLPEESQFGVFAMNKSDATLQNGRNARVSYIKGNCSLDNPIFLTDETTLVYAYYPYKENVESASYINIEASSQTDYLYANGGNYTINQQNPRATLNFRHALSRITFKIKRSPNNTDDYNLQLVGLSNMYANAILDLRYGSLVEYGGNVTLESKIAGDVNEGEVTVDLLVIPLEDVSDREVHLNLDFEKHTDVSVPMPSATWESGKQYTYTVTIEHNKLSISEAVITPWNNNMQENINVNDNHYVETSVGASIGDIYYSDGTYSAELLSNKTPIGIVFALTDEKGGEINRELKQSQHGRIVALQDIDPAVWSEEYENLKMPDWEIYQYGTGNIQIGEDGRIQIWDISGALSDFDGLKNSQYISTSAYPAGYACYMYQGEPGTWYLLSCGELQLVYELYKLKIIYSKVQTCFRDLMIGKPYWTSSECHAKAAVVWMDGEIWEQDKPIKNYLRPASVF